MSLREIFGIEDPNKKPARNPDPRKGEYQDLQPSFTQTQAYGRPFENQSAVRRYEAETGKTKICPACYNDELKRCNCSRCGNAGRVPLYDDVF